MEETIAELSLSSQDPRHVMSQFCRRFRAIWIGVDWTRIRSEETADEDLLPIFKDIHGTILLLRNLVTTAHKYVILQASAHPNDVLDDFAVVTHDLAVYLDRAKYLCELLAHGKVQDREQFLQCRRLLVSRLRQIDDYAHKLLPSFIIQ